MILASTTSKNGVKIRLTDERWKHIVLMHPNLTDKRSRVLSALKNPDYILRGKGRELLAVSEYFKNRYLVIVYKEASKDGFIITAFETTDTTWLFKKEILWSKLS